MRKHAPLVVILAIAAVARFWAIDFGLPHPGTRPDEEAIVGVAIHTFTRDFNPHFFSYPPLFMYAVTAALIPYFKIGLLLGSFRSEFNFLQVITSDPSPVFLAARILSAAAGVLTVWILYRVAWRLWGRAAAIVASALLAMAFLHVRDSHFGVTDVAATGAALLSFLFVVRFRGSGAWRDLIGAAVCAGLATATKYNAGLVVAPALVVILAEAGPHKRSIASRLARAATYSCVLVFAFFLTDPYALIEYRAVFAALTHEARHLAEGHVVDLGRGWAVHLNSTLRYGLGIPLLVTSLVGLTVLLWRQPRVGLVVASFPVVYYLVLGSGLTVFARHMMPVVPFLCLAAAWIITECSGWFAGRIRRPEWQRPVLVVLTILVVAPSAWSIVRFDWLLGHTDSRLLANEWIETTFPTRATLAQVGTSFTRVFFRRHGIDAPPLYKEVEFGLDAADPDILVIAASPREPAFAAPAEVAALAAKYDLRTTIAAFDESARENAYDRQDEFYLPLAGFNGITRPGPNLAIYVRPGFPGQDPHIRPVR